MQQTKISSAVNAGAEKRAEAEAAFHYGADQITRWINHSTHAERRTEALIAAHNLSPLRMSYERNIACGAAASLAAISHHIGESLPIVTESKSHRKIATSRNQEFADQFRAEHPDFITALDQERAPMLAALTAP